MDSNDDTKLMEHAKQLARCQSHDKECPVGCVIAHTTIKGYEIVSAGANRLPKSCSVIPGSKSSEHYMLSAVEMAIIDLIGNWKNSWSKQCLTIYLTHAPDVDDAKLISEMGIRELVFHNDNDMDSLHLNDLRIKWRKM